MISSFLNQFKNIDKKILCIMKYGINFSLILSLISILVLISYNNYPISIDTYYIGLNLFKTSLSFAIEFIVCGFSVDMINKNMI